MVEKLNRIAHWHKETLVFFVNCKKSLVKINLEIFNQFIYEMLDDDLHEQLRNYQLHVLKMSFIIRCYH